MLNRKKAKLLFSGVAVIFCSIATYFYSNSWVQYRDDRIAFIHPRSWLVSRENTGGYSVKPVSRLFMKGGLLFYEGGGSGTEITPGCCTLQKSSSVVQLASVEAALTTAVVSDGVTATPIGQATHLKIVSDEKHPKCPDALFTYEEPANNKQQVEIIQSILNSLSCM